MKSVLSISLQCTNDQVDRLVRLQTEFAQACNLVSQVARATKCWNRVALHHLVYRLLRQQYPNLGSQMACNAIYSVCRACRWAYQHRGSPFRHQESTQGSLPLLVFLPSAPVYFDRHTLSLTEGELSMYTLDGRIHFKLKVSAKDKFRFESEKLKEIALARSGAMFQLIFWFDVASPAIAASRPSAQDLSPETLAVGPLSTQPPYLQALTHPPAEGTFSAMGV